MICDNVIFSEIEAKVRATDINAGWSSPVARQAHNLKVVGSNPTPATKINSIKSVFYKAPGLLVGGFLLGFFTVTYRHIFLTDLSLF